MLERVGLPGAQDKRVDQLSGGQKQRVAIARSLVLEPTLLLLDEPLGALDLKLREHMKIELKQLQADFGTTFVYITHDQSEALVLSDHVAVMNAGRFEQVGTPQELYYEPATPFVAGFVGANNRIAGQAARVDGDVVELVTPEGLGVARARERSDRRRRRGRGVRAAGGHRSRARRRRAAGRAQRFSGRVESLLFDGANSAVLVREEAHAAPRSGSRCRRPGASPTSPSARRSPSASIRERAVCFRAGRAMVVSAAAIPLAPRGAARAAAAARAGAALARRPHRAAARRARRAVAARARRAARLRVEPRAVPDVHRRAAVLAHVRAHGGDVDPRHRLHAAIAFPVAWYIAKIARGRAKSLLFVLCLIPFWVSETVRTLGWMILLRESGVLPRLLVDLGITAAPVELLYHDATILVGLVYTSMLFMVVPLVSALESLDDSLIEAAYDLGGNGWSILRQIVIPHAAPGIAAGSIVVFMLTLGNYLTPTLLGGKNSLWFTEQIYTQFITRFNWEQGAAFGFLLLVLSTAIVWARAEADRPALRRRDEALMIPSLPRSALSRYATGAYVAAFFVFLFVPLAVVAVFAFNDANYPAPPWRGFTLDWFVGGGARAAPGSSPTRRC